MLTNGTDPNLQNIDPLLLAMLAPRQAPPMPQGFPQNTGPGTATPDNPSAGPILGPGGPLRGDPSIPGAQAVPQNPPPQPADGVPGAATPGAPGVPVVPPPALPAPPAAQTPGVVPPNTSSTSPDPSIAQEPTGQPEATQNVKPGGKVAAPQSNQDGIGGNTSGGLSAALAGIGNIKPPQPLLPGAPHVPNASAPHPVHVAHQSQVAPAAQGAIKLALEHALQRKTLGEMLRGGHYA